ncbi:MAG TPA: hypothetical protein VN039_07015 [Nitrospira sp.]|nr:hypothetical protein [Nitrospira sp.]
MSPDLTSKITLWRAKAVEGTLTLEEMKEAIQLLRGERVSAAQASDKARRTKAIKAIPTADDLLKELGEL